MFTKLFLQIYPILSETLFHFRVAYSYLETSHVVSGDKSDISSK